MPEADATRTNLPAREILFWTLLAGLVRISFCLATPQVIDSADSILYLDASEKFAAGAYTEVYPRIPLLYPFLGALASRLVSNIEVGALLVSLISLTLLVPVLFSLSHAIHGRASARFVALTASLWPWLVDYSCRVAPESLYALLWFTSAGLLIRAVRRGGVYPYALAVALFMLYLARPEGFLIVIAVLLCAFFIRRDVGAKVTRIIPAIGLLAVTIPLHFMYLRHLSANTGIAPRVTSSSISAVFADRGWDVLSTGFQLLVVTVPVMLGPVLLLLLLPGVFARLNAKRDKHAEYVLLVLALVQLCAAALSTFAEPRYVMTTIVALGLWSGRGAAVVTERLSNSALYARLRYAPAILIALMMSAGLMVNIVPPLIGKMSYKPLEYKRAGMWMRDHLEPGLIMSRKPQVGYYAKMPTTGPAPEDSLDDIHSRVVESGAKYLVVDERYSADMIPALRPLLDPAAAPSWLRLLRDDLSPYAESPIVVYEVVR